MKHPLIDRIEFLPETPAGGQRTHIAFPHLSGSQLSALTWCGVAYYFARRVGLAEPLNTATLKGSAFHEGAGDFLARLRDGELPVDALKRAKKAAVAYIKDALGWTTERPEVTAVVDYGQRWPKGPRDTPRTIALDVLAALDHIAEHPFVLSIQTLSVERGYVIYWTDPDVLPLVGYTDAVFRVGDRASIFDWKTSAYTKGFWALGMDLTQVGYAYGAAEDTGLDIESLNYGTLAWKAPSDERASAEVTFELQTIPFEPERIQRLFKRCVDASRDLRNDEFRLADSDKTCPTCAFRGPCSERFGPLPANVLDSATYYEQHAPVAAAESSAPPPPPPGSPKKPNGPSAKQASWILTMLQQSNLTVAQAMTNACLKPVDKIEDIPRAHASSLIDYLKVVAEAAVRELDIKRRADRQIAQATALLAGLPTETAERVTAASGTYGLQIDPPAAARIMQSVGKLAI